jgi:protein-tyrosine phosphatase
VNDRIAVCFVCAGNICRSPTAEGIFRHLASERGAIDRFEIDSAGTGNWHEGEAPDPRAFRAAGARGIPLGGKARQFQPGDFARFDYVLALDATNAGNLRRLAQNPADAAKVHLLRSFDPASPEGAEVPDPYYGGPADYELVVDQCLAACAGLLDRLIPSPPPL